MNFIYQVFYHEWETFADGHRTRRHVKMASFETIGEANSYKKRISNARWFRFDLGDRLSIRRFL